MTLEELTKRQRVIESLVHRIVHVWEEFEDVFEKMVVLAQSSAPNSPNEYHEIYMPYGSVEIMQHITDWFDQISPTLAAKLHPVLQTGGCVGLADKDQRGTSATNVQTYHSYTWKKAPQPMQNEAINLFRRLYSLLEQLDIISGRPGSK